jgi:PASTA domain
MQCSRCGADNPAESTFCRECNRFLHWSSPPATTGELAPPAVDASGKSALPSAPPPTRPPPPSAPPSGADVGTPARPAPVAARPAPEYRLTRGPVEPVSVEPTDIPRPAPWSERGVGSNDSGHGLYMVVDTHELSVVPGAVVGATVRVRNSGLHVERGVIETRGLPSHWVTVDPPGLDLDVASEKTATVTFHPPRVPSSRGGRYPFEFTVSSASWPNVRCSDGAALTVGTFAELACDAELLSVSARGSVVYRVRVHNDGNQTVDGRMIATDEGEALRARFEPASVEIAPGSSEQMRLVVTPKRHLLTGDPVAHVITAQLVGSQPPTSLATLQLHQRPLLPRWAAKMLAAFVVLLIAGAVIVGWSAWSNRSRSVPDVQGLGKDKATGILVEKGFHVDPEVATDSTKPKDVVDHQDPPPKTKRRGKSTVVIYVSNGVQGP